MCQLWALHVVIKRQFFNIYLGKMQTVMQHINCVRFSMSCVCLTCG